MKKALIFIHSILFLILSAVISKGNIHLISFIMLAIVILNAYIISSDKSLFKQWLYYSTTPALLFMISHFLRNTGDIQNVAIFLVLLNFIIKIYADRKNKRACQRVEQLEIEWLKNSLLNHQSIIEKYKQRVEKYEAHSEEFLDEDDYVSQIEYLEKEIEKLKKTPHEYYNKELLGKIASLEKNLEFKNNAEKYMVLFRNIIIRNKDLLSDEVDMDVLPKSFDGFTFESVSMKIKFLKTPDQPNYTFTRFVD